MPTSRKVAILLLLAAVLAASSASAARARTESPRPAQLGPAAEALLHQAGAFLTGLWSKIGCHIDPDGLCTPAPAPTPDPAGTSDIGCGIDPNGLCHP